MEKRREWLAVALVLIAPLFSNIPSANGQQPAQRAAALFKTAFELFQEGQFEAAVIQFQKGLEIAPKDYRAHFFNAQALERLGRIQEARASYAKVVDIAPDSKEAALATARLAAANEAKQKEATAAQAEEQLEVARRTDRLLASVPSNVLDYVLATPALQLNTPSIQRLKVKSRGMWDTSSADQVLSYRYEEVCRCTRVMDNHGSESLVLLGGLGGIIGRTSADPEKQETVISHSLRVNEPLKPWAVTGTPLYYQEDKAASGGTTSANRWEIRRSSAITCAATGNPFDAIAIHATLKGKATSITCQVQFTDSTSYAGVVRGTDSFDWVFLDAYGVSIMTEKRLASEGLGLPTPPIYRYSVLEVLEP